MQHSPVPESCRYFLGGNDLEMQEIRILLAEAGLAGSVVDRKLAWGARASAYATDIAAALAAAKTPVLVELEDDLPTGISRDELMVIDHHGVHAGKDKPSSLRQLHDLLAPFRSLEWTRRRALVAANDIGHAPGLRQLGASADEIRAIRDQDRAAQGVSAGDEAESRRAVAQAQWHGRLLVVTTSAGTSSAVGDFLLTEYGGCDPQNLLVVMPGEIAFFGHGGVIAGLAGVPGCWWGGALPQRGFWGAPRHSIGDVQRLIGQLAGRLADLP